MTEKQKKLKRILFIHLTVLAAGTAYVLLVHGCPLRMATGIPCPTCGMTRAIWAALHLDFEEAFYYHPLFWFIPLLVVYAFHMDLPPLARIPKEMRLALVGAGCAVTVGVWVIRLANGLIP